MTISSATPAALSQPQPVSQQLPTTQADWQQFSSTLNQWLQYLNGPEIAFTPTLVGTGGGAPVYSAQVGMYSRSGNRLNFTVQIVTSAVGSLSGSLSFNGLPVPSQSTVAVGSMFPVYCTGITPVGGNNVVFAYVAPGSASLAFFSIGTAAPTLVQATQLAAVTNMLVSGSYPI